MKIERLEYRGCLKDTVTEENLEAALLETRERAEAYQKEGVLLSLCIYRHEKLLFVYEERMSELGICDLLRPMEGLMKQWPEETGDTPWAFMAPIYWHQVPGDPAEWVKDRSAHKNRIGRIAFLLPEKLFSYTYWHYAIVQEGLLKGDKFQFISLHENILFSYFEEPRLNLNLKGSEEESQAIKGWMQVDPESHFDRSKTEGKNFLIIDPVLIL